MILVAAAVGVQHRDAEANYEDGGAKTPENQQFCAAAEAQKSTADGLKKRGG